MIEIMLEEELYKWNPDKKCRAAKLSVFHFFPFPDRQILIEEEHEEEIFILC